MEVEIPGCPVARTLHFTGKSLSLIPDQWTKVPQAEQHVSNKTKQKAKTRNKNRSVYSKRYVCDLIDPTPFLTLQK